MKGKGAAEKTEGGGPKRKPRANKSEKAKASKTKESGKAKAKKSKE